MLVQLLKQMFTEAFPSQSGRYPVAVVMISVPPADVDVNFEPNKTSVLLHNMVSTLLSCRNVNATVYDIRHYCGRLHMCVDRSVASSPGLQLCGGKAWYRLHAHALDFPYTLP